MLKLAKIDAKVKYVAPGSFEEGLVNIDTGGRTGVVSENGGKTVFFDHHGVISETVTSSAQLVYETMVKLGLLERTPELDKMIQFVTQMDTKTFPNEEKYYQNLDRTLLGLQDFIAPSNLIKFFEDGMSPTKKLTDRELRRYGLIYKNGKGKLINFSTEVREKINKSQEEFEKAKATGRVVDTPKYGKVLIDIDGKVPLHYNAALGNGCNGYVIWNEPAKEFKIYTKDDLPNDFLPQGKKIRDKMWIKPGHDGEELRVTLEDVISALKR